MWRAGPKNVRRPPLGASDPDVLPATPDKRGEAAGRPVRVRRFAPFDRRTRRASGGLSRAFCRRDRVPGGEESDLPAVSHRQPSQTRGPGRLIVRLPTYDAGNVTTPP